MSEEPPEERRAEKRDILLLAPGPLREALGVLLRRVNERALIACAQSIEEACIASESGVREQHCVLDLRARAGRCHEVFTSLPRRTG